MSTVTKWVIDPTHSEINFKVKHLVISTVTGTFNSFSGSMETENEDFTGASVRFDADIDSIDTNNPDRDTHLKSDDFFNAEAFPKMSFVSSDFVKNSDSSYTLTGDLTIRNITKTVSLDVVYGGTVVDPYGQTKAGFEAEGAINRKEFGLQWSAVTEAGNLVVSDEVRLLLNVQFTKQ
ncbi:MAG: polyisoprenoid-binding protein [Balneolaceae bacterium]|nr:MAG: polyisoprenoid-binding protein [Balneolaceae bacterium]